MLESRTGYAETWRNIASSLGEIITELNNGSPVKTIQYDMVSWPG